MVAKKKKEAAPEKSGAPSLVRMERDGKQADVHPSEVDNWKAHGWREV